MIGVIVQARMGATRLPGKVLKEVLGRPLLFYLFERMRQSRLIEKIIIATTTQPADESIYDYVLKMGLDAFRGSEIDVLDRYYQAARKYKLDVIVRITADCPLFDPDMSDDIIRYFLDHREFDMVRTGETYPEGFDTEVFTFAALEAAWKEAKLKSEREHVTPFIWKNSGRFKVKTLALPENFSHLRFTVDEEDDFVVVSKIIENLYQEGIRFRFKDILRLYRERPEIFVLNQNITRNEGYLKSLCEDKKVVNCG